MTPAINELRTNLSQYSWAPQYPGSHYGARSYAISNKRCLSDNWSIQSIRVTLPQIIISRVAAKPSISTPPEDPYSKAISEAIDNAVSLLHLKDDWDGEGAIGISEVAWQRAMLFLVKYFIWAKKSQILIAAPKIFPTREGGVDLVWRKQTHRLAVRLPGSIPEPAEFTGLKANGEEIDGFFDADNFNSGSLEEFSKLQMTLDVFKNNLNVG